MRYRPLTPPDLKLAVRRLRQSPGLSLMAATALAVGIALSTAAFVLVREVLFSQLPVVDSDRIVRFRDLHRVRGFELPLDGAAFTHRRRHLSSVEALAAFHRSTVASRSGEDSELLEVASVTPELFTMLGATPTLGRVLLPQDAETGAPPVVVLEDRFWRRRFGADPEALGSTLLLGGAAHRVIGVMAEGFVFPGEVAAWLPAKVGPRPGAEVAPQLTVLGRLRPGVSTAQAAAEMASVAGSRRRRDGYPHTEVRYTAVPYTRGFHPPQLKAALYGGLAALTLILLVAAANVANLLLARATTRQHELAIRRSLGATRRRLVGQLFAEALALGGAGAILGGLGARSLLRWLGSEIEDLPFWIELRLDPLVLAYVGSLGFLASAVAGVAPALRATGTSMPAVLKDRAQGSLGIRLGPWSSTLVVAEVALTIGLLAGAAGAFRSLSELGRGSLDLPGSEVLVAQLYLGQPSEADRARDGRDAWGLFLERAAERFDRLSEHLAAELPGVVRRTHASHLPGHQLTNRRFLTEGETTLATTRVAWIGPGFFEALDVPLLSGRGFLAADFVEPRASVIVNEPFARRHLGRSPVGRRIRLLRAATDGEERPGPWLEVVGVVPDIGFNPTDLTRNDGVYLASGPTNVQLMALRVAGDPQTLVPALYREVAHVAPSAQVQWTKTLEQMTREQRAVVRALAAGSAVVGSIALLLSIAGLHAILSFSVTQRRREIGIRLALGADAARIVRVVLRRAAGQLIWGAAGGTVLAIAISSLLRALPFDVRPIDPLLLAAVVSIMAAAAIAACLEPTRRALGVPPVEILRDV